MSSEHRRFLFMEQATSGGIINLGIAALFGLLLFRQAERVPMAGAQGLEFDTLVTAFMIPFVTCLIVTWVARRQVRNGRITMLDGGAFRALMPDGIMWRAILLGAACAVISFPVVMAISALVGGASVTLRHFLIFKLAFASAEGALVTPLIAFVAISHGLVRQHAG